MEKKIYELTVAFSDKKTEKETKSVVEAALEKVGGRLIEFKFWGKKDLVYPIKKQGTVLFSYFEVELPTAKVAELANRLRLNEEVLRHLIVEAPKAKAKRAASAKQKKFAKIAVKKAEVKVEVKTEVKPETKVKKVITKKK